MGFITRLLSQNTPALLSLCFLELHIYCTLTTVLLWSPNFIWSLSPCSSITSWVYLTVRLSTLCAFFICVKFYDEGRARHFDFDFVNMVCVTEMLRIIDLTVTRWKVICLKCHLGDSGHRCRGAVFGYLNIYFLPKSQSIHQITSTLSQYKFRWHHIKTAWLALTFDFTSFSARSIKWNY